MKNLIKSLMIFAIAISMTSCSDDDNNNQPQTIAQIASSNANLSILVQALQRANLVDTFNSAGDFTVFAPTDAAFTAFLATTPYATVNDVPVPILTEILKNHVLAEGFTSSELMTGYYKTLAKGTASSTNTLSMYIDLTSGVKINGGASNGGANVVLTSANILASNGVIHVVDNVIGLPTVVNHAIANPNFTSLVGALTGAGQPDFPTILSGTGPFTVFAPTNAAFTSLDAELQPGGIAGVPAATLTTVLQYHVVSGNVLSSSLTDNMVVTPLAGGDFTIGLTGGAKITDGNNRVSNIIATDVQASNGVIHVLDKVLLP
ncbi:fasciclin domain-containing protein [Flavobacterium capsici]|uniref:Fasciclin domain-containing protein n=1 Tax=Flavobacterium capsici TaxID=3075618 RepID=A0AA96F049_9FLAO|nr:MULTISPECIES: fasciclin domain-containing protein [unclassified Flavobacterium]WNM20177.1 fasciclin domain-containing protein [Flavobacterium sp. PMR2A8]WNM21567.1 fasciclin domain-containing protein [Flavobacterium sp. PMTSA4]